MMLFVLLCVASVFAGCGIATLAKVQLDETNLFLAPCLGFSGIAVLLGVLVASGFAVSQVTGFIYAVSLILCGLGFSRAKRISAAATLKLVLLGLAAYSVILPSITEGFQQFVGGSCLDGWSYVTLGQSLMSHGLGSDGWFPLDVQYSSALTKATRFISAGMLALFAPLAGERNDTQEALGPYFGWLFFIFGNSCFFFAKVFRLERRTCILYVALAVLSGWAIKVINANNLDHCVALSFIPAACGLAARAVVSRGSGVLLGLLIAANLYSYPESFPFLSCALALIALQQIWGEWGMRKEYVSFVGRSILSAIVFASPYWNEMFLFVRRQAGYASLAEGSRPGEGFYRALMLPENLLPGLWGFVPDFDKQAPVAAYVHSYATLATIGAGLLTIFFFAGTFTLFRQKEWAIPLFAVGMISAYFLGLERFHYPYGAYKVAALSWFAIVYVSIIGCGVFISRVDDLRLAFRPMSRTLLGLLLVIPISSFALQQKVFYDSLRFKSIADFKALSALTNVARGQAVAVFVNEMNANLWATHFLRDCKLYLGGEYRGYMIGYRTFEDRSTPIDVSAIHYAVTDNSHSLDARLLMARLGPYYVWGPLPSPWTTIAQIDNGNGLEGVSSGTPFFWLGNTTTTIDIFSSAELEATVSADFALGPGLPGKLSEAITVAGASFARQLSLKNQSLGFKIPLKAGMNTLTIRPVDQPTAFVPHDPRPLLVHVQNLSIHPEESKTGVNPAGVMEATHD